MLVTELQYIKEKGYYFGDKTWYTDKHLGIDYPINKVALSFPVKLTGCSYTVGKQGGLTVTGKDEKGYIHRFMHLESFLTSSSTIEPNTQFAISGNTGEFTTAPHLHWDIRKPLHYQLNFINFINPDDWKKDILPKLIPMELPQWFYDNKTQEFCEQSKLITDWSDPFRLVPQYVLAEYIRKEAQIPTVKVHVNHNRFSMTDKELQAYKLAVRDVTRFFLPFINLEFQAPQKSNITIGKEGRGIAPEKGVNLYILENLDEVQGESINGYAVKASRSVLIDRDRLTREDEKDRGMINAFAATLAHELCHIFGHYFSPVDETHHYDYNFTLANYLVKIQWTRLNTEDKIKFNFE